MAQEKKPTIRPLGEHVLVRRQKKETVTPGGLIIPQEAQSKADRGEVIAVGPGRWNDAGTHRIEPAVKRGDVVLLPKYAGAEDMRGALPSEHLLIRESDILAVDDEASR